ncbi:MAG: ornithine carbamoyltransferase [Christensenellales bacterium]|jgi:ornithine carbamoyltransferase
MKETKNKHLLTLLDYSKEEITQILGLADILKADKKAGREHQHLKGKTLGMIFDKSSTRTRVSFEAGMYQLGGHALHLNGKELQMGRGEPVEDTARVLSRYIDGIMIRTFDQELVEKLAKHGSIPVINGLTDLFHPCQVLADLMTMREYLKSLDGKKLCFIGDGNNMANSLIIGGLKMGMKVACASPKGYEPAEIVLKFAKECGENFLLTDKPLDAAEGADVVVTDVWTSMGQEAETERRKIAFEGYIVDEKLMSVANAGAIVQHCLPAHRGEEISAEMFEAHAGEIFEEAENRLHAQKAVLVTLMGD